MDTVTPRLEDIELIKRLKYRYWRSIDMGDIEAVKELLTEDVKIDYVGGSYRWRFEGRETFLQALAQAFSSTAVSRHTGSHPEIDVLSETTARGIWYLSDMFIKMPENILTEGAALYHDEYVKRDGAWRIQVSTYERIYERVEQLPQAPNLTAHYLARKHQAPGV